MPKHVITGTLGHEARVIVEADSIEEVQIKLDNGEYEVLGERPTDDVTFTPWPEIEVVEYVTVRADCHTDDYAFDYAFDAAPWFEMADWREILDLHKCDWGGDDAADEVAISAATHDERLANLFSYLAARNKGGGETVGFECHVNGEDAREWLALHRPAVEEMLKQRDLHDAKEIPNEEEAQS